MDMDGDFDFATCEVSCLRVAHRTMCLFIRRFTFCKVLEVGPGWCLDLDADHLAGRGRWVGPMDGARLARASLEPPKVDMQASMQVSQAPVSCSMR
jgi:hypothetical protein